MPTEPQPPPIGEDTWVDFMVQQGITHRDGMVNWTDKNLHLKQIGEIFDVVKSS